MHIQEEAEDKVRTRTKVVVVVALAAVAVAVLISVPVIPNPAGCDLFPGPGGPVCIPNEMDSVSYHYLGFGVYSSYKGEFYYFCTPDWCQRV